MMPLGGGRAIITLQAATKIVRGAAAVRDRGKWLAVTSFLSLHSAVAECGPWQVVMMTCKTCLLQSMIRINISGYDMSVVRMWYLRVSCASPWGSPDRRSVPRVLLGKSGWVYVPHVIRKCVPRGTRGRGPYNAPFLTCRFLPEQNGRVKNDFFWNWSWLFCLIRPRGERGRRDRKAFMRSRRLWVFPSSVLFWIMAQLNV